MVQSKIKEDYSFKCGRILCQKKKSVSLLSGCLYPKPLVPLPKSIAWERHYERIAIEKYTFHMKALGKIVSKSGFIVHPEKGWLGASPDGFVKDTTYEFLDGLLEIKCPYSKREELALTQIFFANWKTPKLDSKIHMHTSIKSNCRSMLQVTYVNGATSMFIPAKVYPSSASSLTKMAR